MRFAMTAAILLAATAAPLAAQQQSAQIGQRVDRLEREMRAVQRKVFPGAAGQQYFEPEVAPPAAPPPGGVPAANPVADLTSRVASLEQELSRLTGQVEQNSFKLRQIEEQMTRFKADAELRMNTLEGKGPAPAAGTPTPPFSTPAPPPSTDSASPPPAATPPGGRASTGDAGEDAYLASYDLWAAKNYTAAETRLRDWIAKYPGHKRASFARNLLGRTLLDSGQPAKAAQVLLENYKQLPRGERAADSLYYLGQSLMALRPPKPSNACEVYRELEDVYGPTITAALRDRVTKAKADAKCKA